MTGLTKKRNPADVFRFHRKRFDEWLKKASRRELERTLKKVYDTVWED